MRGLACVLVLVGCGTDVGTTTSPSTDADGGVGTLPSEDDPPGGETICAEAKAHGDFDWIQQHVFTPSCASSHCHGGSDPEVGLSLEAGKALGNLVDHSASTAQGWDRVVPGSPSQSYLLVALGRGAGPMPRDGFMPLGAEPLCTEKIDAIERWIILGAGP